MKTLEEQLTCARRELAMRRRVYPRWVQAEKMSPQTAAHETACMEAIVATLQRLVDREGQQPSLFAKER